MAKIAIIGAGLSGLVLARELEGSHDVVLFEKSRGVGGRMATRYADPFRFDHGAQFFTARSKRFRNWLEPLLAAGVLGIWTARFAELSGSEITGERQWDDTYRHYVGTPGMNALPKHLAKGLDVRLGTRVVRASRPAATWTLETESGEQISGFDWLICTQPSPQTADLIGRDTPLGRRADAASMKACYALMLGFDELPENRFDAARVLQADISWISVNSSKPGRGGAATMVVHATNAWADANLDTDKTEVEAHMLSELSRVASIDGSEAQTRQLHRWLYANADKQSGTPYFLDTTQGLAACGDWFIRGRIEAAFRSAVMLADDLLANDA